MTSLRAISPLDGDCERLAYRARTQLGQLVLTATDEQLDEVLGHLATEARRETKRPRRRRLDIAYEQLREAARVPERARHQVRVECEVALGHLTVVERRAPWRDGAGQDWTAHPIARLRYAKTAKTWTLYWRDRDLRFHIYRQLPPSAHVDDLLSEVDSDPNCLFWG